MARPSPRNEESHFRIDELFFSRTDMHGIISAGNHVFQRVSGYSTEHLIGAPHNLIRHPDMPKAVFKYLWDTIQAGHPVVAYVKNLNVEGKYYWVVAAVFPVEQGYVSVRLKPSTEIFQIVQKLYPELLEFEKKNGMEKTLELLVRKLGELGFSSYQEFARTVLVKELDSRDRLMDAQGLKPKDLSRVLSIPGVTSPEGKALVDLLRRTSSVREDSVSLFVQVMNKMAGLAEIRSELRKECGALKHTYEAIQHLSVNMSVEADRAGDEGRTLAVISETFQKWAEEVRAALTGFISSTEAISDQLENTTFNVAASRFQLEMMAFYTAEIHTDLSEGRLTGPAQVKAVRDEFVPFIGIVQKIFSSTSRDVASLLDSVKALEGDLSRLRQALNALYIIRQNGRVEVSRMATSTEALNGHISDMAAFIGRVDQGMGRVENSATALSYDLAEAREAFSRIQSEFTHLARAAQ